MKNRILFEDNHLIAVMKNPSDIVQGDKTGDLPLSEIVKGFIKKRDNKPGNVYLGVIHRIDRPVSGVILFAKTSKALSRMNKKFQNKQVQKTYLAVVEKTPKCIEEKIEHMLRKNSSQNKSYVVNSGGKASSLTYKLLDRSDNYSLLEITPHTGRHHQIRCQLSHHIAPIKGDVKYGAKRANGNLSIHLHAFKIEFEHPVKKEKVSISSSAPQDALWDFFKPKIDEHFN